MGYLLIVKLKFAQETNVMAIEEYKQDQSLEKFVKTGTLKNPILIIILMILIQIQMDSTRITVEIQMKL